MPGGGKETGLSFVAGVISCSNHGAGAIADVILQRAAQMLGYDSTGIHYHV
ncbi:hypothetical protein KCP77_16270 [Salmonella enterica subsp. enterica]|nr:hypothetical protein KCP77_16270 [Salmonella enterica subsp. enterica]